MWSDIRYGWRFLASKTLFTNAVVVTLAFGVGLNTAAFAVFYTVLLAPLSYPNAGQLVDILDVQGWSARDRHRALPLRPEKL